jgi:putative ABC transport system permease protein
MIRTGIRRAFQLALRRRDRWEREVEDEIRLHLSLRTEQLVAQGATADEAYREALRRFGPLIESRAQLLEAARHREHRMQRTEFLSDLRQDVAFAWRTLARQRSWTTVTVLTLALGIGATTAVFSVVSTLMLHPLSYPNAGRIVYVAQSPSGGGATGIRVTMAPATPVFRAWRTSAYSFEALVGFASSPVTIKTSGEPTTVNATRAVPEFAKFAGQQPLIGRMFTARDIEEGGRVVLLSEAFWRERLGSNRQVLGQAITANDSLYTVIGVMPAALKVPGVGRAPAALWFPLDVRDDNGRLAVIARLRPGVDIDIATRELDSLFARSAGFTSGKIPFRTQITRPGERLSFRDSLIMLTAAVGLVLLIACANVAHLLIARGATRQRELAIRAALGAGRGRLLRQLLTESMILATLGTALGIFAGWIGLKGLIALRPAALSELNAAHLDATTLAVAAAVAVVSGVAFGVIGAMQSARHSTQDSLKAGSLGLSGGNRNRFRSVLVITEMALSATLLVGATMLVRSVIELQRADLGFEPKNLYDVYAAVPKSYATPAARAAFLAQMAQDLRQVGGVTSVAVSSVGPGSRNFAVGRLEIEGEPPPKSSSSFIEVNEVDPSYFKTMRIRLESGSVFSDTSNTSLQVIVNAGFAKKHWAGGSAIGHRLRVTGDGKELWLTIVGVAADASTSGPMSESSALTLYRPFSDYPAPSVAIRTNGDESTLIGVRAMLARAFAGRRPPTLDSVAQRISLSIAGPRFVMLVLAVFTILALVLAGIGLYGVMAFLVTQETREIGIRMALGATRARIAQRVFVRGTLLAAIGAIIGLVVSRWGTRLIENQLFGVSRSDSLSLAVGTIVLITTAILACLVPTRRALAIDPMTAIRAE